MAAAVYELLLRRKTGPGIDSTLDLDVEGALAQSFEFAPDGMTVAFKLRPGVRFHNVAPVSGRVMDMEDWRQSFQRYLALNPLRTTLQGVIDNVQYPDEQTMVVRRSFPTRRWRGSSQALRPASM